MTTRPLSDSTAIAHGCYLGSTDPGAVGPGKFWADTTASTTTPTLKVRAADNLSWLNVGGSGGGASGTAGGVLSGTYPNPGFAVAQATQAALNSHAATLASASALGHIKVGTTLAIAAGGTLDVSSVPASALPSPNQILATAGRITSNVAGGDAIDARARTQGYFLGFDTDGQWRDLLVPVASITGLGTAAAKDIPASGNAASTEVVYGSDTRLTDSRAPTAHQSNHQSGGIDALSGLLDANARIAVRKNGIGATIGTRRRITFNEQTGISVTITDDSINEELIVALSATGGVAPAAHHLTHEVGGGDALSGRVPGQTFEPSGLTGATAASRYIGATASGAPTSGTFVVGDWGIDQTGKLIICTAAGTPGTWAQVGGVGTVTSVALTVPSDLSVSGSPITGAGTLAITRTNQSANTVMAGPASGSAAAPTFRALVAADIPAIKLSTIDRTIVLFEEEFIGGNSGAGPGVAAWGTFFGTTSGVAATAGHVGVFSRVTVATGAQTCYTYVGGYLNNTGLFVPTETFDSLWIARINQSDAQTGFRIGFASAAAVSSNPPGDGIYIEKLAADTAFFAVCRASGVQTRSALSVNTDTSFHRFRIRRVDSSTIGFSIDGGTEVTITTNVPTLAMLPWSDIETTAAAAKTAEYDYFALSITGLNR